MILEHARLNVIPGHESEFEMAFRQASGIIGSTTGFRTLRLERCIEEPNQYLLLVEWDRLEDHVEGLRNSPDYDKWRALLHHFYEPFPTVEHYQPVLTR